MRVKGLSGIDIVWTVATFVFLVLISYIIAKVMMPKLSMDVIPLFFPKHASRAPNINGYFMFGTYSSFSIYLIEEITIEYYGRVLL